MRWWHHSRAPGKQRGGCPDSRAAKTRRSPSQTRALSVWVGLFCLGFSTTIGRAQDKAEVPQGYEDALPAGQRPRAARAAPAGEDRSLLEMLTDALGEVPDPNVRKLEVQYLPQFQQLLTPELAFVRRVCEPDKEQFREVAAAVRERLAVAVKEYAVSQNRIQKGRVRRASLVTPQPRTLIQRQVTTIVKAKLRPEQAERYQEECKQRTARRKRAVVLNLVAKLDEELVLSADQREKLIESLTVNYQQTWDQWLPMLIHIPQFTPDIPQDCVLPSLNGKQKAVWRQTAKTGINIMGGIHFAPPAVVIEDAELEELENGR